MIKRVLMCCGGATILFAVTATANDIYKWTDANGEVHFGQERPAGTNATQVRLSHDARSPQEKQAAQKRLDQLIKEAGLTPEQIESDNAQKEEAKEEAAETASVRQTNCENARHLLSNLENWADRAIVENPDGSQTRLDNNQRQALIDRTLKQKERNCDN